VASIDKASKPTSRSDYTTIGMCAERWVYEEGAIDEDWSSRKPDLSRG
jgi:hypothetical protein